VGFKTAQAIASGEIKVSQGSAEAWAPFVSGAALLMMAAALVSVWIIGRKSPTMQSFGKSGRRTHVVFATVYAAALIAFVVLARY
jgi:Mg/Co/Ni transporter MgtE